MSETDPTGQNADDENAEFFVTSGLPSINNSVQKIKNKQKKANKNDKAQAKNAKSDPKKQVPVPLPHESAEDQLKPKKRGQHGRQKKLKEKYKFQDDEERHLRMQLLRVSVCSR
jgi:hypothetical protein